jgi:hypothetical protein
MRDHKAFQASSLVQVSMIAAAVDVPRSGSKEDRSLGRLRSERDRNKEAIAVSEACGEKAPPERKQL